MRFRKALLAGALGIGLFCSPGVAMAGLDSAAVPTAPSRPEAAPAALPARPGSESEAREYELREEASPEVQDYAGGEVIVIGVCGLLLFLLILVILFD